MQTLRGDRASRVRIAQGIALAIPSFALVLLAAEGALRAYHAVKLARWTEQLPPLSERALVPSDDPLLGFEFNPGWRKDGFSINSRGMPDRERALEKPEGVVRIAFVGDSLSANFGYVDRDDIYLNVLEAALARIAPGGTRVECLNFGVNGYGILQSLQVARTRALAFEPDAIVAQLFLNDPYASDTEYGQTTPRPVLRLADFLFLRLRPERFYAYSYVERLHDEAGWANVRAGLTGFAEIARSGVPVWIVLFPYLHPDAYGAWSFGDLHDRYRGYAEERGLAFLDLRPVFERAGLLDAPAPDPQHPDARGHAVAAEAILAWLRSRGALDRWHLLDPGAEPRRGSADRPGVENSLSSQAVRTRP